LIGEALVAGATGIVGRRIAERLRARGWDVTGLCRRPPAVEMPCPVIAVDLSDLADCKTRLGALENVTHVFYAARYDHPEGVAESVETNAAMLENLIEALEPAARRLCHVNLIHGTKYYGHMLGPLELPLTEETPRAPVPNFYFDQEDFVIERSRARRWTYSTARPHTFCDVDCAEPRNAALLIAVYATLARELCIPLAFPGSEDAFQSRTQFTFVPMLARAVEWMATEPFCANQSYNITNGDCPRWSELWPRFAAYFGLAPGGPSEVRLADVVAPHEQVWRDLVERHALEPVALKDRVLWPYADYLFAPQWDIISSVSKARRDGFGESIDSGAMFTDLFDRFRLENIIP
jgi:nucleoside-diphosphate-sugar epimerase